MVDGIFDEVHPAGDVRSVGAHGLQRGVTQQHRALRHGTALIDAAIHQLRRQKQLLDLFRADLGSLVELFDVEVQLIAHLFQPPDQRQQVGRVIEIVPDLVQRQTEVLQAADAAQLSEGVDAVVAVAGSSVSGVGLNESPILVMEDDAVRNAQRLGNFPDRKKILSIF